MREGAPTSQALSEYVSSQYRRELHAEVDLNLRVVCSYGDERSQPICDQASFLNVQDRAGRGAVRYVHVQCHEPQLGIAVHSRITGEWRMYRNGELVNVEGDPKRSPLSEIFRWATLVARAEDHTEVRGWRPVDEQTFTSVTD